MGKILGGHIVARMLAGEGVRAIFTLCGGHVAPIYDGCLSEGIEIIDVRHEQAAAHAADAWARLTRGIGVAVVTAGPGVTGTVTAVANAQYAGSPLLVIGGAAPRPFQGKGALQEMEQVSLLRPITKWSAAVPDAARLPEFLAKAFRIALEGRPGPVFLEIPFDVLSDFVRDDDAPQLTGYKTPYRPFPDPEGLKAVARRLSEAKRPVLIAGSTAYWDRAGVALSALTERWQLPTYLNGMGRGLLPPDHPAHLLLSRGEALKRADVVILAGTPLDFRMKYGAFNPAATLIQIEPDATTFGQNRATDIGLIGDVRATLLGLHAALEELWTAPFNGWWQEMQGIEAQQRTTQAALEARDDAPVNHFRFAREIENVLDERTTVIGDGGDVVAIAAKVIRPRGEGLWLDPGPLGCLGVGAPFALAVKKLRPDHKVLVISGDGAFGLNGMEIESAARQGLPFVTIVGNDAQWGQIRNPQLQFFGEDRAPATQLAFTRYDHVGSALGGAGILVEGPDGIGPALHEAFAAPHPVVINVALDPKALREMAGRAYVM